MKSYETSNYIFHFQENSTADRDILKIAKISKAFFDYVQLFEIDEALEQRMEKLADS